MLPKVISEKISASRGELERKRGRIESRRFATETLRREGKNSSRVGRSLFEYAVCSFNAPWQCCWFCFLRRQGRTTPRTNVGTRTHKMQQPQQTPPQPPLSLSHHQPPPEEAFSAFGGGHPATEEDDGGAKVVGTTVASSSSLSATPNGPLPPDDVDATFPCVEQPTRYVLRCSSRSSNCSDNNNNNNYYYLWGCRNGRVIAKKRRNPDRDEFQIIVHNNNAAVAAANAVSRDNGGSGGVSDSNSNYAHHDVVEIRNHRFGSWLSAAAVVETATQKQPQGGEATDGSAVDAAITTTSVAAVVCLKKDDGENNGNNDDLALADEAEKEEDGGNFGEEEENVNVPEEEAAVASAAAVATTTIAAAISSSSDGHSKRWRFVRCCRPKNNTRKVKIVVGFDLSSSRGGEGGDATTDSNGELVCSSCFCLGIDFATGQVVLVRQDNNDDDEEEKEATSSSPTSNIGVHWDVEAVTGELCFMHNPRLNARLRCDMAGSLSLANNWKGWEVFRFVEAYGGYVKISSWMHRQWFLCSDANGNVLACSHGETFSDYDGGDEETGVDELDNAGAQEGVRCSLWAIEKARAGSRGVTLRSRRFGRLLCVRDGIIRTCEIATVGDTENASGGSGKVINTCVRQDSDGVSANSVESATAKDGIWRDGEQEGQQDQRTDADGNAEGVVCDSTEDAAAEASSGAVAGLNWWKSTSGLGSIVSRSFTQRQQRGGDGVWRQDSTQTSASSNSNSSTGAGSWWKGSVGASLRRGTTQEEDSAVAPAVPEEETTVWQLEAAHLQNYYFSSVLDEEVVEGEAGRNGVEGTKLRLVSIGPFPRVTPNLRATDKFQLIQRRVKVLSSPGNGDNGDGGEDGTDGAVLVTSLYDAEKNQYVACSQFGTIVNVPNGDDASAEWIMDRASCGGHEGTVFRSRLHNLYLSYRKTDVGTIDETSDSPAGNGTDQAVEDVQPSDTANRNEKAYKEKEEIDSDHSNEVGASSSLSSLRDSVQGLLVRKPEFNAVLVGSETVGAREVWKLEPSMPRAVSSEKIKTFAIGTSIAVGTTIALPFALAGVGALMGAVGAEVGVVANVIAAGLTGAEALASVGAIGATAYIVFRPEDNSLTDDHEKNGERDDAALVWSKRPFSNWRNW